jgi:hypothetical protein
MLRKRQARWRGEFLTLLRQQPEPAIAFFALSSPSTITIFGSRP